MRHRPRLALSRGDATKFTVTISAVCVAGIVRWFFDPLLGETNFFFTFLLAVILGAWIDGWRSALLATILGTLAAWYFFIPPRLSFAGVADRHGIGIIVFSLFCLLIILFGEAARKARELAKMRADILRITLGSIGDAVITTDASDKVTFLNEVAQRLTGWTADRARGKPLGTIFPQIGESTPHNLHTPPIPGHRSYTLASPENPLMLVGRDAVERPIESHAATIYHDNGKISGGILVFRDITERRQLEETKADQLASARFLAAIIESSEDAIISKSLDGVIQSWNAAAERLFGYSAREAIGRQITMLIPAERTHEEEKIVAQLRAGMGIEHFDTERVRSDGQVIPVSLTISPIRNEDGQVIGASKIVRDISDRKRAEAEIRNKAEELAAADRRKDEFLATLAHELRNPLAPIRSGIQILQLTGGTAEDTAEILTIMERQLEQMIRLVDDLLDVSRISRGKLELKRIPTTLDAVIASAIETSRPLIDQMGHKLTVALPQPPIALDADLTRLAQAFLNLLNNAAKYSERGGHISVKAERRPGSVAVSVCDTGIGIPPDQQSRIFEMFSQVDHALDKSQGGLGIGLTLVKRIVELHGGGIEVRSEGAGRGSEFCVRLPIASETVPPQVAKTNPVMKGRQRVLVVDDNRDGAASLCKMLSLMGNETTCAYDGEEALAVAERFQPNVVLLDIGLPKLDGYEVCRRLRQQPDGGQMLIIAQTGWGKDEDRQRSLESGFDHHLVKPIDPAALVKLLDTVPRSGPQHSSEQPSPTSHVFTG